MRNNKNIVLNIFWIVLGSILLVISSMGIIGEIYTGFGAGLLGVGIVQLIRAIRYKTNTEFRENVDIEIQDERNRYMRMKAWSWAGYLYVLISAIAVIVCMILSLEPYMQMAAYGVCLMLLLYWGSYLVIRKKY